MTTIEKLERLVREEDVRVYKGESGVLYVYILDRDSFPGATLTEAVDKAYEAAFPTRTLEPGDLFLKGSCLYCVRHDGATADFLDRNKHTRAHSVHLLSTLTSGGYTIIGKALDEPIEVKW